MARQTRAATPQLLAQSCLEALRKELTLFEWRVQARGEDYAARGCVKRVVVDEAGARASVRGTRTYDTAWVWGPKRCLPSCSCPVAPYCKHAYALACVLVGDVPGEGESFASESFDDGVDFDHELLSDDLLDDDDDDDDVEVEVEPHGARTPQGAPRPSRSRLDGLRTAEPWRRHTALQLLLVRAPVPGLSYQPAISSVLEDPDPELLCWRLAREIARRAEGWLPPELVPYRERPELAARYAERTRGALARELVEWGRRQRATPQRRLRVVFGLAPAFDGHTVVTLEVRVTTPRLADEPRTALQLHQLRSDVRRSPGLVAPEHAAVLEWLADYGVRRGVERTTLPIAGVALGSLLARVTSPACATIASWGDDLPAEIAARAGVQAGAPVRFTSEPVRLVPICVARDGDPCVDLAFVWPDGRQCPLDEVVYVSGSSGGSPTEPSLVLAAGEFSLVVEEPPRALLDRFADAGGLVLPADEREATLATLAASFPHLREALRSHTRFHAVTMAVTLDLRDDDWLHLRVLAHAGATAFEYRPACGWIRLAGGELTTVTRSLLVVEPPATAATSVSVVGVATHPAAQPSIPDGETWIEAPHPPDVEPLVEWLGTIDAGAGTKSAAGGQEPPWHDRHIGWWMHASRRRMERFAEAWEQRPRGVTFFGTERVRRLLCAKDRVAPRLRVTASGVDWLAIAPEWESEGARLSDADLAKLRTATTCFVRLASGWVRRDLTAAHDESAALLADVGIEADAGEQRLTLWQLAGAKPESVRALVELGADASTIGALERLRERVAAFAGLPGVALPAGLKATLRPYQQQGLDFLAHTASLGIGAVLADDMGLGKTVQALAWLLHLRELAPDDGPSLVVCPASVVHNWAREAERFAPGLRVLLLTSGSSRHALRRAIPEHDLLVTTYALLRRDLEAWREVELRAAILDEAQMIKNPDAVVAEAARMLRARHRLALTGTPLENRALDLWSIVSFVNPGYLGSRAQFSARYDRPDAPPHARALLAAKLRPILLRRLKREVATDLPERIEERRDCELTKGQRQLYVAELRRSRALVDALGAEPGGVRRNKITILAALTRLRQICCHPTLAGGKATLGSGKFDALAELLEPLLAEGHKVLLFSQFVRCLRLLQTDLLQRGVACHMLTGATVKREAVVRAFSEDERPCVFLVSLKAGGTGLNLTSASYVVLFDPWWNPAVEAQAIDRTHRIGQDRTVVAYRLLALGTIEERIWELQQRKAALVRDILGEDGFARALTHDDLAYLLAES